MRRELVTLLAVIGMALLMTGRGRPAPSAAPVPQQKVLLARIEALEGLIPDQAHIMADVGDHFTNLWFAGRAGNWPLADFYLNETRNHLRWAVRRIPIRKDSRGQDIHLGNILEAFENSQLKGLKQAIDGRDRTAFERVYRECLTGCYSCHKASDKPYSVPRCRPNPKPGSSTSTCRRTGRCEWRCVRCTQRSRRTIRQSDRCMPEGPRAESCRLI
jgi:hypothetical protein